MKGLSEQTRLSVASSLSSLLADEFVLYTKTLRAHWNVEGIDFKAAHSFFGEQYEQLSDIIDSVAERIRAIGHKSIATLSSFSRLTSIKEDAPEDDSSKSHYKVLLDDHEAIILRLRGMVNEFDKLGDQGTCNFATDLMEDHEKMAWMLRSSLK